MFAPRQQRGQAAIEYGLLIALVCLSCLVLFIPTIIIYQWMRQVRHADRTTAFMFAIGFTTLMGLLAHEAKHLAQHHKCCEDETEDEYEDESIDNPGCECCEAGCLCPAFDCGCRCSRDGDRFCCGREFAPCSCGIDCECCCNLNNCLDCGNCCHAADEEPHCDCPPDCDCCCNKARCPDCGGPVSADDEKKGQAEQDDRAAGSE